MRKNQNAEATSGAATKRPRAGNRRDGTRRADELERRLREVEELARANRRELDLQFQRMAQMQVDLDMLMKLAGAGGAAIRSAGGN